MTIIYPLIAMIFLTIIIGVQLLYCNTKAILNGEVDIRHFRLFNSKIPKNLQSISQHYKNMFEMPILFYILLIQFEFSIIDHLIYCGELNIIK